MQSVAAEAILPVAGTQSTGPACPSLGNGESDVLSRLDASVARLVELFPQRYPGAEFRRRLDDFRRRLNGGSDAVPPAPETVTEKLDEELHAMQREMLLLRNPLVATGAYYGSYFGRRNLKYRGLPDFRPTPTLESTRGVPPPQKSAAPVGLSRSRP